MVNLLFCRPGRCTALARCPNLPGSTAMPSPSLAVLVAFIAWTLLLLALMEILRTRLVLAGKVAANRFAPDNAGLSPFMQRLARAHANCIEGLPPFGGLLLAAVVAGRGAVT